MQRIKMQIESQIVKHPWFLLVSSFGLGLILALFVRQETSPRASIPGLKEGFLVVLSTANLTDPPANLQLRGSRVQLVHRDSDGSVPCRARHPPLVFAANERTMTLSGSLEDLEATILAIAPEDLKRVDLARQGDASLPPCSNKVKIIYGQEGSL
jgi:hypothetical protein